MSESFHHSINARVRNGGSNRPNGRGNGHNANFKNHKPVDASEHLDNKKFSKAADDTRKIETMIKRVLVEGHVILIEKDGKHDLLSYVYDFSNLSPEDMVNKIHKCLEETKAKIGEQYTVFLIDIATIDQMAKVHYNAEHVEWKNKLKKILGKIEAGQKVDISTIRQELEQNDFSVAIINEIIQKINKINKAVEKLDNQVFSTLMTVLTKAIPRSKNRTLLVQKFDDCGFYRRLKGIAKNGTNIEGYDLLNVYFWSKFIIIRNTTPDDVEDWIAAAKSLIEKNEIDVIRRNSKKETSRDSYMNACEKGYSTYCEEMIHVLSRSFAIARRNLWADIIEEALNKITYDTYKTFSDSLKLVLVSNNAKFAEKNIIVDLKPGVSLITEFVNRVINHIPPFMGKKEKLFFRKAFHYLNTIFLAIGEPVNIGSPYYDLLKEEFGDAERTRQKVNILKASFAENVKNRFSEKFMDMAETSEEGIYPQELDVYSLILGYATITKSDDLFGTIPAEKYRETKLDDDPEPGPTTNFFTMYPFLFQFYTTLCSCLIRVLKHTLPPTGVTDDVARRVLDNHMKVQIFMPKMIEVVNSDEQIQIPSIVKVIFPEILSDFLECSKPFKTIEEYIAYKPIGKKLMRQLVEIDETERSQNDDDEWKRMTSKTPKPKPFHPFSK